MARLTVYLKDVTHYTLRGRSVKRSTNKIARTPFDFSAGKTCFMEATPWLFHFGSCCQKRCISYLLSLQFYYSLIYCISSTMFEDFLLLYTKTSN